MPTNQFKYIGELLLIVSIVVVGCQETTDREKSHESRTVNGKKAPYSIAVNSSWETTTPSQFNPHADLSLVNQSEQLRFVVIPQRIEVMEGLPRPETKHFYRTAVTETRRQISRFRKQKAGAIRLDRTKAVALFADGFSTRMKLQYLLLYAVHQNWGYQVIAWGPFEDRQKLINEVEKLIQGWKFSAGADNNPPRGKEPYDEKIEKLQKDIQPPPDLSNSN